MRPCPRCSSPMPRPDVPRPDGGTAWVDRCERCGTWYDGDDLPALHPDFANAPVREALLGAPAAASQGRPLRCPSCGGGAELAPVLFVGVTLDACPRCRGVWVDRDEHAALVHAMRLHTTATAPRIAHYRAAPVGSAMARKAESWTRCVACGVELALGDALASERGFVCVACGAALADA